MVAVALLIIGFNILKGNNLFSGSETIYAIYENVSGLAPASPVQVNGLKVGSVSELEVADQQVGKIRVRMTIQPGIRIPQNSVAKIVSTDLLGSKAVMLEFGNATEYLRDNDTIRSAPGSSLTSNLMSDLKPLSGKIQNTLVSLDTVLNDVHTSLNNETRNNLQSSIAQLNITMKNFARVSGQLDLLVKSLNGITDNLKQNNDTINRILGNTQRITAQIAGSDLQGTIADLHQTVKSLGTTLDKANSTDGSLGLLLNDKKLYENLEAVSNNLNLLMEDMRLNPQRYVHFSLFGRKNKVQPLPSDTLN